MERIQAEIETGTDNITLAWTPRWLLSSIAIGNILADEDKHNARTKVTFTSGENNDKFLKNSV